MKLLDLFCGAGGAAMGYYRAGFAVLGVDHLPQKHFPFEFHQADAFQYLRDHGHEFDVIHASPPCQAYTACKTMHTMRKKRYPAMIPELRTLLMNHRAWVMENVYGAPLRNPVMLCGLSFGLRLFRHRYFESPLLCLSLPHIKHSNVIGKDGFVCMVGHGDSGRSRIPADHRTVRAWQRASDIDWMNRNELSQAIPPAYTEWIGKQIRKNL
jgi:DNA (cytosine-5)-methyltransferase 1